MKAVMEPERPEIVEGEHLIEAFVGDARGPTLIIVGSVHGNEPAGVKALLQVTEEMSHVSGEIKGRIYFIAGNTRALPLGVRFIDRDLNRTWTQPNLATVGSRESFETSECKELSEIDQLLDSILITAKSEVYVLDLHSTSARGEPFATVGDTLRNREFARKFPVTILLGIEEQLEGTMLEYINNTGAVTFGFEGGNHTSDETVANHAALIWLAMANTGILTETDIPDVETHRDRLAAGKLRSRVIEVRHREAIEESDGFEMNPGFNNFDAITKGQILAKNRFGPIRATESGLILMPLYQKLGEDGFFIGREVAVFWLAVSAILRRAGVQRLMPLLPGVRRDKADPETLIVNTKMARFFPLQIFHLLGFRKIRWKLYELVVTRRRHDTESPFTEQEN
jgi:succinylglutamate desuccinylase